MFAKVENGVTKSCQNLRRNKRKNNFGLKFSNFSAGSLVVCESRDRLNRISDRNSQKEEISYFCV